MARKLLIISTTFYPDPQVGAIRMTQWARHLPDHGWKPHVLCRWYDFESQPGALARDVHPDVVLEYLDKPGASPSVGKAGGWVRKTARRLAQMLIRYRGFASLIVPDPSIRFWRLRRQYILRRVREIAPDVILTTSPPHANHDVGRWLSAQTGIPWVADFRDPHLIDIRFRPYGLGLLRWDDHKQFKASIYKSTWFVTHAIPTQQRWVQRHHPVTSGRSLTLTNGYPPSLLEALEEVRAAPAPARRTILVAGTIPEAEQITLSRAVAGMVNRGADVQLELIGREPSCAKLLREILGDRLKLTGYIPHNESIRETARADVLVNFLDDFRSRTLLLSTKLFEYLASGKPVICINPSRSDRHLLRKASGVIKLVKPALEDIIGALQSALDGKVQRDPADVAAFRAEYNWPRRAARLAQVLNGLTAFPPAEAPVVTAAAPAASVVIPTRNRGALLGRCIRSALAQSVPVEVIVMDDGSTDGTAEMMAREFPQVKYCRLGTGMGPAFQRNRGIEMASCEIVFPIDDDSVFSTPHVIEQTMREFDHPRIAAVGIPFLNPRLDWTLMQRAGREPGRHVIHAYVGASHAVRRTPFLNAGGYREHFFYMGEEGDLCLRLLNQGCVTICGRSDPIHHMESPLRNLALANRCGRRNDILFAWHNVPSVYLPFHLVATTYNGICTGLAAWQPVEMLKGLLAGYAGCCSSSMKRRPVDASVYRLHRRLKKRISLRFDDIESLLPPLNEGRAEAVGAAVNSTTPSGPDSLPSR